MPPWPLAREIGYENAGTVEFLLGADGRFAFIEINPRIQVEHTVTEETTEVDLVRSQILIAGGATLSDLGLTQDSIRQRGVALQCRVTTENPANGFRPDAGRITAYRSPGGAGIRLDEGSAFVGAEVSPFFDPLLVKITARGADLRSAAARAGRAVAELRVRGVSTNQSFLRALLRDRDVLAGNVHTTFVDEHPELISADPGADRASRLLSWLTDVTINREREPPPGLIDPRAKLPPLAGRALDGSRQRLRELGPAAFAAELRSSAAVAVTDTTLRDAHQSLLATRMRTFDMLAVAPHARARHAGAAVARVLGRGDLRRRAALPPRGPLGAPRAPARSGPEHLPADAPARQQPARLLPLPAAGGVARSWRRRSRAASTSSASSTPSTTSTAWRPRSRRRSRRRR